MANIICILVNFNATCHGAHIQKEFKYNWIALPEKFSWKNLKMFAQQIKILIQYGGLVIDKNQLKVLVCNGVKSFTLKYVLK